MPRPLSLKMAAVLNRMFPVSSKDMKSEQDIRDQLPESSAIVVLGDRDCFKTSILFQCGLSFAADGKLVTYICRQPFVTMPIKVHGLPAPSPHTMKNLNFQYVYSTDELIRYLGNIHLQGEPPTVIIIDDFQHYVQQIQDGGKEQAIAKLCALVIDACSYIQTKSGTCHLVLSSTDTQPSHTTVYQRFNKCLCHITVEESHGAEKRLNVHPIPSKLHLKLVVKDEIFLDKIMKETEVT
ncbi:unnamed protein product [Owenia fusiformis]|uniref:Uncharacterized protein n=1 Tax=Owenia fusiformis TaxID=6347 RepID=A0A8J1TDJ0_OWEFU|nr:unnamed protein product [Owenia fusiformis]